MQRKPTKNTRGPNAAEKRFQGWLKEQPCVWCGMPGPSIVDHARGATFKHNKTLIGHWFCLPACVRCDHEKTVKGKRQGNEVEAWYRLVMGYELETGYRCPDEVVIAILDFGR